MFKKIGYIIVFLLLFIISGCDESENYEGAGASSISYPLNASPLTTDQTLGINDPAGTWAINRFSFGDIFALYLTQDFVITGAVDTSGASSNISGPIELTPIGTLPDAADGKIFSFTGLAGFLGNSVFGMYDGATPVYHVGFETPPTTLGDYMSWNPVTGKWDVTPAPTGGGASITEIASEPDPNDMTPSTLYINQDDGGLSYLLADSSAVNRYAATSSTGLFLLTLTDPGNNDYIQSTDGFLDCGNSATDCTYLYASGATPELTATADTGRQYDNWTGDLTQTSTTTNPDTILMDAAKTVSADFSATASATDVVLHINGDGTDVFPTYTLDVTETGPATGTITSTGETNVTAALIGLLGWDFTGTSDKVEFSLIQPSNEFVFAFLIRFTNTIVSTSSSTIGLNNTPTARKATVGMVVGATTELNFSYREDGGTFTSITTTIADIQLNTTYAVQVTTNQTTPLRKIEVYNSDATVLIDSTTNNAAFVEPSAGYTTAILGTVENSGVYIDNFMVSNDSTRDFMNDEIGAVKMILINDTPNP